MPFTFNAVKLCVVTINEKPWTRAKEACRVLEYNKKTVDIVKAFCSRENYAQKYQMSSVTAAGKPVDWLKDSQEYDIYINEEGMYELLFSSRQPKGKDFRRQCCNVLFPHVRSSPLISYMPWKLKILQAVSRPLSLLMNPSAEKFET